MFWFTLSLVVAFLAATESALTKKFFGDREPVEMMAIPLAWSSPMLTLVLVYLYYSGSFPGFSWELFWAFIVMVPVNALAVVLHMTGINRAPLSLTMPFLCFTPAFAIMTGALILGETVSPVGASGILAVVAGSYVLNLESFSRNDLTAPFRAMFASPGVRAMLAASALYSVCLVLGKKIALLTTPLFTGAATYLALELLILCAYFLTGKLRFRQLRANPVQALAASLAMFGHVMLHQFAIIISPAAYMVSVKRLSSLFSVLYGGLLLKEKGMLTRLAGTGLMLVGTALITLGG